MSTDKNLRRRSPATGRRSRPPHHPSSPPRRQPLTPTKSTPSQHIDFLHKSQSEPLLFIDDLVATSDCRSFESDGLLYRPKTWTNVFSSSFTLIDSPTNRHLEGYQKDAKVVVNVTVEGSPGPIRTLIKLGSSVDETIKHVIRKYGEEGRSPRLDCKAASSFDLHLSYFSLESLERSNAIGDSGSRSFYLRKNSGSKVGGDRVEAASASASAAAAPLTSEIVQVNVNGSLPQRRHPALLFLPAQITRKFNKIARKICKLWKILGCFH